MPLVASPRGASPVPADARLSLVELLLSSIDLETSVRASLDWLVHHLQARYALCAVLDVTETRLVTVAEHGGTWNSSLGLHRQDHPLIAALADAGPRLVPGEAARAFAPEAVELRVCPLRMGPSSSELAEGLLAVDAGTGERPEFAWFTGTLASQVARLRSRQALEEDRSARERMLLYSSLNAVTDPILLTDPEGRLIIANARAEKLFTCPDDASEGWRQAIALNNMLFSAALSTTAVEEEGSFRRELVLVDSIEGSDLLFELLSTVTKDPREGTYVVSVLRNITDLRRAKEEIEESQRKLRIAQAEVHEERRRLELIIDSVADPIVVTDPSGAIVLMNAPAEKLFTTGPQSPDAAQRYVHSNGVHFSWFVSSLLSSGTGQRWGGEIGLIDPETGAPKPVEAITGMILSEQGELSWVVAILHDRTEAVENARLYAQLKQASKELEAKVQAATAELVLQNELLRRQALELEKASALKTQFLANMSHELRTPLNAMLGYAQILRQGLAGPLSTKQMESLARIESNGRHLLTLINEILDISRIEAGRMPLQITEFRLPALIDEVTGELEPLITRSGLDVSIRLGPRVPALRTDRQKVKQILLNLLANAVKFTASGWVRVDARYAAKTETVAIAVSDSGPGIAPEDQEKIFEQFRQLDESTSRGHGGTGLGLSICRGLAAMLDGRVTLKSRVGRGSTFTLVIPARMRKPR